MNEQLIKFIELCLMDGVITDKEREVIFRKSKKLGVDEDECEIILEGMILKYNKENNIQYTPAIEDKTETHQEKKIVINKSIETNVDEKNLKRLFFSEKGKFNPLIENRISTLNKEIQLLIKKRDKCDSEFHKLFDKKRNLTDDSNPLEIKSIDNDIFQNDQELIVLKKEIILLLNETNKLEKYSEKNLKLFILLYKKSPLLYQTPIFDKLLQEVNINNDKQILNLTRVQKFLVEKEKKYGNQIGQCFKKLEDGSLTQKDVDLILIEKKSIISFSNSFHLMFNSLTNNQMGVYMKIYLELESMGIFNTQFEKEVLKNLNQMGKQLNKLNNTLSQVSKEISQTNNYLQLLNDHMYNVNLNLDKTNSKIESLDYSLGDISYSIKEGNKNLYKSVDFLKNIQSGVRFNNLLTGIQTYQTYNIGQNTRVESLYFPK